MEQDMLKKLMLATAIVGATISTASAATVTGDVDLQVKLPEVLVLYHWDKAGIEFNPKTYDIPTGVGTGTYDFGANDITVADNNTDEGAGLRDIPMNTDGVTGRPNGTIIPVTLKDAWAVRTLTENGKAKLAITNPDTQHKKGTTGSVVSTQEAKVQTRDAPAGENITIPSKWAPTTGDITFNLDLSAATQAGLHVSDGSTFTLTLSSAP